MRNTQHSHSKLRKIAIVTCIMLFAAPVTALAYSATRIYYGRVYTAGGSGYYSTIYGWVGARSAQPAPVPIPAPTPKPNPAPVPTPAPVTPPPSTGGITAEEMQMVNLVNQERAKAGLAPLAVELNLVQIARIKSQDMVANNYFGHTSPTFGSTFNLIDARGFVYRVGGENIAGAADVQTAFQMLMNSPGHRANIMNPSYNRIGVGIVHGGPYGAMFTQLFLG